MGKNNARCAADRDAIDALAAKFETAEPADVMRWALARFGKRVALACSFGGASGMALLDMAVAIDPSVTVTYVDTGLLFPETHALLEAAKQRYGVQPIPVRPSVSLEEQARLFGDALWARDPDLCCTLRKVLPQHGLLAGFDAWITGLRRDQSATRRGVEVVEWDAQFHVIKVNPLARWTEDDVWRYMKENDVPYNALHDRGYPSIGCTHCTVPVSPGEPLRAGRWPAFRKTECGLHARSVRS